MFAKRYIPIFCLVIFIASCAEKTVQFDSLEENYWHLLRQSEKNPNLSSLNNEFPELINAYPGTKYASYARLRMAEMIFDKLSTTVNSQTDLQNAEIYYRSFLIVNPGHPLESYILNRLVQLAYIKSVEGLFVQGTDPEPYYDSIQIYNNFLLLHLNSIYFEDIKFFERRSRDKLAEHEHRIADWYFNQEIYAAAINRYEYIFSNYPNYSKKKQLASQLILAYRKNLQNNIADERQKIFDEIYEN